MEQDYINGSISQIRLVEVVLLQNDIEKALKLFKQLPLRPNNKNPSEHYNKLYQKLKLKLKVK